MTINSKPRRQSRRHRIAAVASTLLPLFLSFLRDLCGEKKPLNAALRSGGRKEANRESAVPGLVPGFPG